MWADSTSSRRRSTRSATLSRSVSTGRQPSPVSTRAVTWFSQRANASPNSPSRLTACGGAPGCAPRTSSVAGRSRPPSAPARAGRRRWPAPRRSTSRQPEPGTPDLHRGERGRGPVFSRRRPSAGSSAGPRSAVTATKPGATISTGRRRSVVKDRSKMVASCGVTGSWVCGGWWASGVPLGCRRVSRRCIRPAPSPADRAAGPAARAGARRGSSLGPDRETPSMTKRCATR